MLVTILVFGVGFICGIAFGAAHLRLQRKKIKFYEFYIDRRLRESLSYLGKHGEPQ